MQGDLNPLHSARNWYYARNCIPSNVLICSDFLTMSTRLELLQPSGTCVMPVHDIKAYRAHTPLPLSLCSLSFLWLSLGQ